MLKHPLVTDEFLQLVEKSVREGAETMQMAEGLQMQCTSCDPVISLSLAQQEASDTHMPSQRERGCPEAPPPHSLTSLHRHWDNSGHFPTSQVGYFSNNRESWLPDFGIETGKSAAECR